MVAEHLPYTPAEQESDVPLGWKKPTRARPVPSMRCAQIKANGERCNRWSLRGYHLCYRHGGSGGLQNVTEYSTAMQEAARLRLFGTLDEAVDHLEDLMRNAQAEGVRLKAVTEVLDRGGVRGGAELDVTVQTQDDAAGLLRQRLTDLQSRVKVIDGDTVASTPNEEEPRDG